VRKPARYSISISTLLVFFALFLNCLLAPPASAADGKTDEKWLGVDETVVAKYAADYGREPVDPLINTDQGDLLLFVFLLGGALGGFICGYYWRVLIEGGNSNDSKISKTSTKTNTGRIKKTCAVRTGTSDTI